MSALAELGHAPRRLLNLHADLVVLGITLAASVPVLDDLFAGLQDPLGFFIALWLSLAMLIRGHLRRPQAARGLHPEPSALVDVAWVASRTLAPWVVLLTLWWTTPRLRYVGDWILNQGPRPTWTPASDVTLGLVCLCWVVFAGAMVRSNRPVRAGWNPLARYWVARMAARMAVMGLMLMATLVLAAAFPGREHLALVLLTFAGLEWASLHPITVAQRRSLRARHSPVLEAAVASVVPAGATAIVCGILGRAPIDAMPALTVVLYFWVAMRWPRAAFGARACLLHQVVPTDADPQPQGQFELAQLEPSRMVPTGIVHLWVVPIDTGRVEAHEDPTPTPWSVGQPQPGRASARFPVEEATAFPQWEQLVLQPEPLPGEGLYVVGAHTQLSDDATRGASDGVQSYTGRSPLVLRHGDLLVRAHGGRAMAWRLELGGPMARIHCSGPWPQLADHVAVQA